MCGDKGQRIANCTEKPCSGCNLRRHTPDACPAENKETVLAVTSEVGARDDDADDGTVQDLAFKDEETCKCGHVLSRMGGGEFGMAGRKQGLDLR